MKCEAFSQITDLVDYLTNNLLIAYFRGFDIMKPLPSYWTFDRFLRNLDNQILKEVMQSQVLKLAEAGIIDTSFISLDSTPQAANTHQNTPKSFAQNKFVKDNQPKADKNCRLGVHSASNQHNDRKRGMLKQKFCCPFKLSNVDTACPCNHPRHVRPPGKKSRGCTKRCELPSPHGEARFLTCLFSAFLLILHIPRSFLSCLLISIISMFTV